MFILCLTMHLSFKKLRIFTAFFFFEISLYFYSFFDIKNWTKNIKKTFFKGMFQKDTLTEYSVENHPSEFWISSSVETMRRVPVPGDNNQYFQYFHKIWDSRWKILVKQLNILVQGEGGGWSIINILGRGIYSRELIAKTFRWYLKVQLGDFTRFTRTLFEPMLVVPQWEWQPDNNSPGSTFFLLH